MTTVRRRPVFPVLPYADTSGWSGQKTSRDRALRNDRNGTTATTNQICWDRLGIAGTRGHTVDEVEDDKPTNIRGRWHRSRVSSAFTGMHKKGLICRIDEERGKSGVYVLPQYVDGRKTLEPGSVKNRPLLDALTSWMTDENGKTRAWRDPEAFVDAIEEAWEAYQMSQTDRLKG